MCYISLNKYSAKSLYSPDSPTWLPTMYGTDLHTFGDLTRIRQNRNIRRNRRIRQLLLTNEITVFTPDYISKYAAVTSKVK